MPQTYKKSVYMNQIEKIIDIATWNRKEHFEHFSAFDDPFFGVTVNVDCTRAYREAASKAIKWCAMTAFCPKPL